MKAKCSSRGASNRGETRAWVEWGGCIIGGPSGSMQNEYGKEHAPATGDGGCPRGLPPAMVWGVSQGTVRKGSDRQNKNR